MTGLVYRCYQYAIENTIYQMILPDMSASYMAEHCYPTEKPEEGDLIFMGEEDSDKITHIAIFLKQQENYIYFIDSTQKEAENINGVTERHYTMDSKKIKSFGIMKLKIAEDAGI
ncbi:MAG: NlpC/P60 family protein [Treponema sp.]|nr:NlpC/P60 family protein [Spirochaetia bacterium]MDD7458839.1 NlpC/P60 family protein [Spirochaetales bacterium]MDY5811972.1 NlpC/P60 family protein [Treponema sp.]